MKTYVFKLFVTIFIISFFTSCNKWYDDDTMIETVLTNGIWEISVQEYSSNCEKNILSYSSPDRSNYRVYKSDGFVYTYSLNDLYNQNSTSTYLDSTFYRNKSDFLILQTGDTIWNTCKYGEWWIENNKLVVKNYFAVVFVNEMFLRVTLMIYNNIFKREYYSFIDFPFITTFEITKYNDEQIILDNYFNLPVYEYDEELEKYEPTEVEYTLHQHFEYLNLK
ncbi:MAG: hypothetical protein JXL97_07095 [Bacteroidales bacterium]|nr:hypothetical protein [Bacteroidales bacterium]